MRSNARGISFFHGVTRAPGVDGVLRVRVAVKTAAACSCHRLRMIFCALVALFVECARVRDRK